MNGPGSMQKKFMDRAQLPGKTSKKLQISIPKNIYMKKMCSETPEILKSGVSEDDFSV